MEGSEIWTFPTDEQMIQAGKTETVFPVSFTRVMSQSLCLHKTLG